MDGGDEAGDLARIAAEIALSYSVGNPVRPGELPDLVKAVHETLYRLAFGPSRELERPPTPQIPIRKTVTPDYIISLEDGRRYKMMKRHLTTCGLTPETYRAKWGLPSDYPMVAANYAKRRSDIAVKAGLGRTSNRGDQT